MASPTKQTEKIRKNKMKKMGRARKNALNNKGSTLSKESLFQVVSK